MILATTNQFYLYLNILKIIIVLNVTYPNIINSVTADYYN